MTCMVTCESDNCPNQLFGITSGLELLKLYDMDSDGDIEPGDVAMAIADQAGGIITEEELKFIRDCAALPSPCIPNMCGAGSVVPECEDEEQKCEGADLHECVGGQWILTAHDSEECPPPSPASGLATVAIIGGFVIGAYMMWK